MTDNEVARKAWAMGCRQLVFYAKSDQWVAMGTVLDEPVAGVGNSPWGAMLDYIAATSRDNKEESCSTDD